MYLSFRHRPVRPRAEIARASSGATSRPQLFLFCLALPLFGLSSCGNTAPEARRDESAAVERKEAPAQPAPAEAQVYEDEAMLRGSQAVIGGTVENVGGRRLEDLLVVLELRRRDGGQNETRELPLTPDDLGPGERGRYSITLPTREWSSARVLRLRSGGAAEELAFRSARGALRPHEKPPEGKVVVVPRPRSKGEEFINSPDNPDAIP